MVLKGHPHHPVPKAIPGRAGLWGEPRFHSIPLQNLGEVASAAPSEPSVKVVATKYRRSQSPHSLAFLLTLCLHTGCLVFCVLPNFSGLVLSQRARCFLHEAFPAPRFKPHGPLRPGSSPRH